MITEQIKFEKKEGTTLELLPENIYQVELLDVNMEERATYDTRLKSEEEKEYEKVLTFQFVLLSGLKDGKSLRGRSVWENFVPTYLYISKKSGKNKLYQVAEGLLGRNLSMAEEAEGFSGELLNSLVGKQVRVGIKHTVKGEKTYERIEQYYPIENEASGLTSEEKEKAQVKKKEVEVVSSPQQSYSDIPTIDEVPFPTGREFEK